MFSQACIESTRRKKQRELQQKLQNEKSKQLPPPQSINPEEITILEDKTTAAGDDVIIVDPVSVQIDINSS